MSTTDSTQATPPPESSELTPGAAYLNKILTEAGLTLDAVRKVGIPTGNVALFGRTGTGKSTTVYWSQLIKMIIVSDTGSMGGHKLYALPDTEIVMIDIMSDVSPIIQVDEAVQRAAREKKLWILDSWTTLQECEVAWVKRMNRRQQQRNKNAPPLSVKDHQAIVGNLRDLALTLSPLAGFTVFNTSPGGKGKTPEGAEIVYPAGCITGYPALNGTGANSETILARWSTVWGVFQGHPGIGPRGLYVPGNDRRPESHATYSPLKDPLMVVRDTTEGQGFMAVPDLRDPDNFGRCFLDEMLVNIAAKWRRRAR